MGLCRELRKGNIFLICICSHPLQRTQYPVFFILRSPWTHRTCWSQYRKSQRLEISLCDSSFLPLLQRKSPTAEVLSRGTQRSRWCFCKEHLLQGSRRPAPCLRTPTEEAEMVRSQSRTSTRLCVPSHPARIRARAALCRHGQQHLHRLCRHHRHPERMRTSANNEVRKFLCHKHIKNKKLGLFTCKSANYF